jgi:RNA polymerase sigma-70 factor (ECF subfamily)
MPRTPPGLDSAEAVPGVPGGATCALAPDHDARIRALLADHYNFVWRQLRRLGLPADHAEDAAQQVFVVASRRVADILPGSERSFLFGTARRIAAELRRKTGRRPDAAPESLAETPDAAPLADELVDRRRARAMLDDVLDGMQEDVRAVFILFELEELTIAQIAELMELPIGTVGSRLRRGRNEFREVAKRLKARGAAPGARR